MNNTSVTYQTLSEIQLRKDELQRQLHDSGDKISTMAHEMFMPEQSNSRGEMIAKLISNSITAIDAFLLFRKLTNKYGSLFFKKGKKVRR